jgi:predicted nucleotidyltransferase
MERDRVIAALQRLRAALEARGIARIGVFGSVARGEQDAASDIDLIVTPAPGVRLDLIDLGGVQTMLEDAFAGRAVDLVIEPIKRDDLQRAVERDRLYAF